MKIGSGRLLELEPVACALCRADRPSEKPVFEGYDIEFRTCDNKFTFFECTVCGHWYLTPRPREEDIPKIYENYLTQNESSAYRASGFTSKLKRNLFDKRRMQPLLDRLENGSRVLEIGAGSGDQLAFFSSISPHPIELYANDISFDEISKSRLRDMNCHRLEGPIESIDTDARFDVVVGVHVIEHVGDPRAVLQWIADHLAPSGVLYLETPDTRAPARHIFKAKWGMTHFPRHFHLFSRSSLRALTLDCGLEIERHEATTSAPAWNMSIRNTLGMDALEKHDSIFEMFNYSNILTLSSFTLLDLGLILFGFSTSTQKLIARKPDVSRRPDR